MQGDARPNAVLTMLMIRVQKDRFLTVICGGTLQACIKLCKGCQRFGRWPLSEVHTDTECSRPQQLTLHAHIKGQVIRICFMLE